MLERFLNQNYTSNIPSQPIPPTTNLQVFDSSLAAFREVVIQVFDSIRFASDRNWYLNYALMIGDGMIFGGPQNPGFGIGPCAGNRGGPGNGQPGEADGWFLKGGWRMGKSRWGLDMRFDTYDRLKDDSYEIEYKT